jgi:hypothetical protein
MGRSMPGSIKEGGKRTVERVHIPGIKPLGNVPLALPVRVALKLARPPDSRSEIETFRVFRSLGPYIRLASDDDCCIAGAVCEGRGIQRQSIWYAGLSGLSRTSNQTNETDRRNQMNQIPATRREMFLGPLSIPSCFLCDPLIFVFEPSEGYGKSLGKSTGDL